MNIADELKANPERYQDGKGWLPAAEIARLLVSSAEVPNPEPRRKVPVPFDIDMFIAAISPETCTKLAIMPAIVDFVQKARGGDREGALRWVALAAKAGILPSDEMQKLQQLAAAEIDDPNWRATVTIPAAMGSVRADEVQEALEEISRDN